MTKNRVLRNIDKSLSFLRAVFHDCILRIIICNVLSANIDSTQNPTLRDSLLISEIEDIATPGPMNSLFRNFAREFRRGILGGVQDHVDGIVRGL